MARTYGLFTKIPEKPQFCIEKIHGGERFPSWHQCNRRRGHGPKNEYCKIHSPEIVKARSDARSKKFQEACARRDAAFKSARENAAIIADLRATIADQEITIKELRITLDNFRERTNL